MARTIFAQDPEKYIPALAEALKAVPEFKAPEWAYYVKSGASRQRPPASADFWYIRSASILRQLYIKGVVGVGKLRTRYGSRKDRGGKPDKFFKSSGKLIRVILQQAEAAGLVERVTRLQHGRRLTQKGRDFLDSIEEFYEEKTKSSEWVVNNSMSQDVKEENEGINEDIQEEGVEEEEENAE